MIMQVAQVMLLQPLEQVEQHMGHSFQCNLGPKWLDQSTPAGHLSHHLCTWLPQLSQSAQLNRHSLQSPIVFDLIARSCLHLYTAQVLCPDPVVPSLFLSQDNKYAFEQSCHLILNYSGQHHPCFHY
jgi:hypothetical protein